mgnify:CR=1 FL=1
MISRVKFRYFKPDRRFLGALMAHAADPASPLSPFGEPSREIREFDFAASGYPAAQSANFFGETLEFFRNSRGV